jgi:Flp pilus assembly protein TadG
MRRLVSILRDERGSPAIEFAIVVPTLLSVIYGITQLGFIFMASAGMQHALGEGARYGALYVNGSTTKAHTEAEVIAKVQDKTFGMGSVTPSVTITASGTGYMKVQITYTKTLTFLRMQGPSVTLTRSKMVYTPIVT